MFRKLHSNRDPRDTILTELKKEFAIYFEKASSKATQALQKKPAITFGAMIILLAFSAILSFTLFRNHEPAEKVHKNSRVNAVQDGFSQILSISATIKQSLALKHEIDSLSGKKLLTKTDSEVLVNDLDKLHQLNKPSHP